MQKDVRTPDKLMNQVNNTWEDSNMWLAPFNNTTQFHQVDEVKQANFIVFTFEKVISLS